MVKPCGAPFILATPVFIGVSSEKVKGEGFSRIHVLKKCSRLFYRANAVGFLAGSMSCFLSDVLVSVIHALGYKLVADWVDAKHGFKPSAGCRVSSVVYFQVLLVSIHVVANEACPGVLDGRANWYYLV